MTPVSRLVMAVAMAGLPVLTLAEGKCNDDPFPLPDGLGVTWSIPMVDAKVDRNPKGTLLADLDARFGAVPAGYPYGAAESLDLPAHAKTDQRHESSDAVKAWLESPEFKIKFTAEHRAALDEYFAKNRCEPGPGSRKTCSITGLDCDARPCAKVVSYGWVVRHPTVPNKGSGYVFCSCMLQRAVLVLDGAKEELWVRTHFRSANQAGDSAQFVPSKPVVFTFESRRAWFPLALNKLLSEPGKPAYLLLDVVTRRRLDLNKIPPGFSMTPMEETITYNDLTWYVTRIWRAYQPGGPASDLIIEP